MGIFGSPQEQVDLDDLTSRVATLEAAVASLQAQLAGGVPAGTAVDGIPYGAASPSRGALPAEGGPWMAEVAALKGEGKLINAIKLYREKTGLGLKEAKDAVEAM